VGSRTSETIAVDDWRRKAEKWRWLKLCWWDIMNSYYN